MTRIGPILLALVLGACSGVAAPGPSPTVEPPASQTTRPADEPGSPATGGGTTSSQTRRATPPGGPPPNSGAGRSDDDGPVGAMASEYLDRAGTVAVEIDLVNGREIPAEARDHFTSVFRREAGSVSVATDDTMPERGAMAGGGGDDRYSFREIRSIAAAHRDERSGGTRATLHVLVLDGSSDDAPNALGLALNASTVVVFADEIRGAANLIVRPADIWRSVLVHELGHVFGLVELVERSSTSRHQDPDHPGHSPNEDSVMYWAIEDAGIAAILEGGPPDDFDAADRADLRDLARS